MAFQGDLDMDVMTCAPWPWGSEALVHGGISRRFLRQFHMLEITRGNRLQHRNGIKWILPVGNLLGRHNQVSRCCFKTCKNF